jgi:hypothetical protein
MRCVLCGGPVEGDLDAVEVHGDGLMHEACPDQCGDEERGLFGEPESESSSAATECAAAFECSLAEIERERRQRAARRKPGQRRVTQCNPSR